MKKNLNWLHLFVIFALAVYLSPVFAAHYYEDGKKKYAKGDLIGAVSFLEMAIRENEENVETIRLLLLEALLECGIKYSIEEKYEEALKYFERAHLLKPEDEAINEMYITAKGIIKTPSTKKKTHQTMAAVSLPAPMPEGREPLFLFLKKFQKNQKKILEELTRERKEFFKKLGKMKKEEREELLKRLGNMDKEIRGTRKTLYAGIGGFIFMAASVVLAIYLILKYVSKRREKILFGYQEKILKRIEEKTLNRKLTPQSKAVKLLNVTGTSLKSKEIGIIEAELIENDEKETQIATRLLDPFLHDQAPQIRAKAVGVLYKYDEKKAIKIIREMEKSENNETKSAIAEILGKVGNEEEIKILLRLLDDPDFNVRRSALKTVTKLKKDRFSEDIKEKINEKIKKMEEKGWLVK